jgi:MFS family permease
MSNPAASTDASAETTQQSAGTSARTVLVLLFLINLLNFYDRQIIAAVTEPVRMEFGLSDAAIGWLGTAFTLFYAAVGLPLGRLADRMSRTRLLGYGVAAWSVCTAASGLAFNYASLFAARMGVGLGEASCSPAANSLIADLYPSARRARALSLFMLGLPIGIFLSAVGSGLIAKAYGWRMAFFVATVPGLVLAYAIARMADPSRASAGAAVSTDRAAHAHAATSFWAPYLALWRIPTLRWIVLSGALHNFNSYAVNAFMPAYLGRYHGLALAQANIAAGITLGLVGVAARGGSVATVASERSPAPWCARDGRGFAVRLLRAVARTGTHSAVHGADGHRMDVFLSLLRDRVRLHSRHRAIQSAWHGDGRVFLLDVRAGWRVWHCGAGHVE